MEKIKSLVRLQESLAKLPSVGKKSAERMAFAMLEMSDDDLNEFSDAIIPYYWGSLFRSSNFEHYICETSGSKESTAVSNL